MKIKVSDTQAFEKEIARLNKRAVRIGFSPITFTNLGQQTIERTCVTIMSYDGDSSEQVRRIPVTVTEYDINLPSVEEYRWVLAATITPIEGNGVFVDAHVRGFNTTPWESASPCHCDHCNTVRRRSLTYVVQNKDDGRLLQVGRNCFADYVGHEGLTKLEFVAVVVSMFGSGDEDFIFPGGFSRREQVTNIRQVIALAELLAQEHGWVNNQKDEYTGEFIVEGTHRQAAKYFRSSLPNDKVGVWAHFNDPKDPIWAKVESIIDQLKDFNAPADDDFATSLTYCIQFEVVPAKKTALVAYAGQFLRNHSRRVEFEAKKNRMVHVGTVGKREDFHNLLLKRVNSYDTQFGTSYMHVFEDPNGNELVWWTSKQVCNQGEKVSLKATVKEHGEFNGAKQTTISRAKVLPA